MLRLTSTEGAQRWDSKAMVIENGVYLGWPAALTFRGPFIMSGVRRGWSACSCLRVSSGR